MGLCLKCAFRYSLLSIQSIGPLALFCILLRFFYCLFGLVLFRYLFSSISFMEQNKYYQGLCAHIANLELQYNSCESALNQQVPLAIDLFS
jgi:hypothetical protein